MNIGFRVLYMMVFDFFQTIIYGFVTFYRSRQVLRSKIHRKTESRVIFVSNFMEVLINICSMRHPKLGQMRAEECALRVCFRRALQFVRSWTVSKSWVEFCHGLLAHTISITVLEYDKVHAHGMFISSLQCVPWKCFQMFHVEIWVPRRIETVSQHSLSICSAVSICIHMYAYV